MVREGGRLSSLLYNILKLFFSKKVWALWFIRTLALVTLPLPNHKRHNEPSVLSTHQGDTHKKALQSLPDLGTSWL